MKTFRDQLLRNIKLPETPKRIISLVPSQTELLVDLGLSDHIVGITKFCVHPVEFRSEKAIVGGTKQIKIERIEALQPDIIVCNKEENTKEIVAMLEQRWTVHVSDIQTIGEAKEMISQYGAMFDCYEKAEEINNEIEEAYTTFKKSIQQAPSRKVAYLIWRAPWMVAGQDTFIDYLLKLHNFENVFGSENKKTTHSRYPEIELSDLKQVDFVFLSSEPFPFTEKHIRELQEYTKAQIVLVDGEYFSWYGSRLRKAFQYFIDLRKELEI